MPHAGLARRSAAGAKAAAVTAVLILFAAISSSAQTAPPDAAAPPAPAASAGRAMQYGVRFGPSFTSLSSVDAFDAAIVPRGYEPTLNFGAFVELDLAGPWSVQPEILFAVRGQRTHALGAPPINTGTEIKQPAADKVVLLRYLEVPMLVKLTRQTRESTSLYLLAGPAIAFRRNAVIREVADPGRLVKIDELVSGTNLSYVVGAGLQHERWLADARLTTGIRNVATADSRPADVKTGAFSVLLGVLF